MIVGAVATSMPVSVRATVAGKAISRVTLVISPFSALVTSVTVTIVVVESPHAKLLV